jgi:hypothetical protein
VAPLIEVPEGKQARFIHRQLCQRGHNWHTYGESETTHWGPIKCSECGGVSIASTVVGALHAKPSKRFSYRTRVPGRAEDYFEWTVDADRFEETIGRVRFFAGAYEVANLPTHALVGEINGGDRPA